MIQYGSILKDPFGVSHKENYLDKEHAYSQIPISIRVKTIKVDNMVRLNGNRIVKLMKLLNHYQNQ